MTDDLELPWFLKRDANNRSPFMRSVPAITHTARPMSAPEVETASDKPARRAPPKIKANGAAKAAPAKVAKGKKAAPAKATKAKRVERAIDPAKLDQFGFRKNSIKSQAAAMYAGKKGATLAEVKEALESTQYNLLTEIEAMKGFTIERKLEDGNGPRQVTRFFIRTK